jgi:hypothetical protein
MARAAAGVFLFIDVLLGTAANANFVPQTKLCNNMTIDNCALTVKKVIVQAQTPQAALEAWAAWVEAYEAAYRRFEKAPVPPTELDQIEDKIKEKVENKINSVTNPSQLAFDMMFKRYLPRLASIVEFADGAGEVLAFLSPSPLVTPVQELAQTNKELGDLMTSKVLPVMSPDWKVDYSKIVEDSFPEVHFRQP